MTNINTTRHLLDKAGIAVTSLCAVHCFLLPFLLPVLPFIGATFIGQESFEQGIFLFTMVLGVVALYGGYKRHHNRLYPFSLLFCGGLIYWQKDIFGAELEPYIVMLGAASVVFAHMANMSLYRRCTAC